MIDQSFLVFVIAGFIAAMIDGALGMAYGVTSTSFLLSVGSPPATASASVHASEMAGGGHRGSVIWLTGLPGSGKSVLADRVFDDLRARGIKVERLDGDAPRAAFPSTGFDREERMRHIRRAGEMTAQFEREGAVVIASFISPYRESREYVRSICSHFLEVFVRASLEVCERRDPKGLFKKSRSGEIKNFTGLDDPYEEPEHPELVIDTEHQSIDQSVIELKRFVDGLLSS